MLALVVLLAGPAAASPVPSGNPLSTSGPRLRTPGAVLARALVCSGDVARASEAPVVLVHGTGSTSEESWGEVYLPTLRAAGHPVCTVQLPERATTDMQVSTEYVVAGVRAVAARRHGKVLVLGHSQGATLLVTALKFWPDLPGLVEAYVGLAPTLTYGLTGDAMCLSSCSAPFQQRRRSSVYFADVMAHPLPRGPRYTTIATRYDEIAAPAPQASHLDGAANVVVQDLCPAKVVDHFGLLVDGSVHALVLEALAGRPVALTTAQCLAAYPPGVDPVAVAPALATAVADDLVANGQARKLTAEPPVRCYLSADCTDVVDRGALLRGARRLGARLLQVDVQAPGELRVGGRVVALRVGVQRLVVPAGPLVLQTRTAYYRRWATERTIR